MVKVLFVCMGNICRSPTAEGVFGHMVHQHGLSEHVLTDSAGTHAYHIGEPPDRRSQQAALKRQIDLSPIRARKVEAGDFGKFDYILAMDLNNYRDLEQMASDDHKDKLSLFLDFAPQTDTREVPDPYYGGPTGFENVLDLIEMASQGLLTHIRSRHF